MICVTYETEKIRGSSVEELNRQLNEINGRIISIKPCVPDWTDLHQWFEVYVEKRC